MNFFSDPNMMGLLGFGAGMLQAAGPSRYPTSIGQAAGQGLLSGAQFYGMGAQNQDRQAQLQALQQQQEAIRTYGASLKPDEQAAFLINPQAFIKARFGPQPQQTQFSPSALGKLIQERDALPPDSPLRAAYEKAIKNASEAQERSPSFQFIQGAEGLYGGNRRTGEIRPVPGPGGVPIVPPTASPILQGNIAKARAAGAESGQARTQAEIDLPRVIDNANNSIQLIDQMIGAEFPGGGRGQPHPGFGAAVGLRVPGMTLVPGTEAANFQALLNQVKGGAFLEAFNSLKGGGQITEVEGKKATDAITRMSNAQTEREFIKAAREYQEIIRKGVERAKIKAGMTPDRRSAPRNSSNRVVVDY